MAHPYKAAAHKNDPKWVKGLETQRDLNRYTAKDTAVAMRDQEVNKRVTAQAAYSKKGK